MRLLLAFLAFALVLLPLARAEYCDYGSNVGDLLSWGGNCTVLNELAFTDDAVYAGLFTDPALMEALAKIVQIQDLVVNLDWMDEYETIPFTNLTLLGLKSLVRADFIVLECKYVTSLTGLPYTAGAPLWVEHFTLSNMESLQTTPVSQWGAMARPVMFEVNTVPALDKLFDCGHGGESWLSSFVQWLTALPLLVMPFCSAQLRAGRSVLRDAVRFRRPLLVSAICSVVVALPCALAVQNRSIRWLVVRCRIDFVGDRFEMSIFINPRMSASAFANVRFQAGG